MINEYLNNIQISEHFFSNEFKCQCCNKSKTNFELLKKLENIFNHFNCSKAIITSGFRCPSYSVKVGGSKTDQHTKGNAVDIIFYDIKGNPIDTRLISCYAQDIGITGIARISNKAIHLDMRTGNKYLGDETIGTNSVCKDFYEYYGISKDFINSEINLVKKTFGLSDETISYLNAYTYNKDLFKKLLKKG